MYVSHKTPPQERKDKDKFAICLKTSHVLLHLFFSFFPPALFKPFLLKPLFVNIVFAIVGLGVVVHIGKEVFGRGYFNLLKFFICLKIIYNF